MKHLHGIVRYGACAVGMALLLGACNDYVPRNGQTPAPPPAEIQGIPTPSSVAVVTATHAN